MFRGREAILRCAAVSRWAYARGDTARAHPIKQNAEAAVYEVPASTPCAPQAQPRFQTRYSPRRVFPHNEWVALDSTECMLVVRGARPTPRLSAPRRRRTLLQFHADPTRALPPERWELLTLFGRAPAFRRMRQRPRSTTCASHVSFPYHVYHAGLRTRDENNGDRTTTPISRGRALVEGLPTVSAPARLIPRLIIDDKVPAWPSTSTAFVELYYIFAQRGCAGLPWIRRKSVASSNAVGENMPNHRRHRVRPKGSPPASTRYSASGVVAYVGDDITDEMHSARIDCGSAALSGCGQPRHT